MNWYKVAVNKEEIERKYPVASSIVDELTVLDNIPNTGSIESSLTNYKILDKIRQVTMQDFDVDGKSYSVSENKRIKELAEEIKHTRTIAPLIVVVDNEGPYILEGSHRIDALYLLGKVSFPALVVIDLENQGVGNEI